MRFDDGLFDLEINEKKTRIPELPRIPELLYINKKSEDDIKQRTIATPFQPVQEFGDTKAEWKNKLIWGDNAQALKYLIDTGLKVDLIYIDPPFATKSDFDKQGEVKVYRDKLAGADFVEFMRERLVLLKELLSDKGSIYVHLDSKMNSYIRVVMDEIFGKANFVNEVIWKSKKGGSTTKTLSSTHNTIYFYSKGKDFFYKKQFREYDKKYIEETYKFEDEKGRYRKHDLVASPNLGGDTPRYEYKGFIPETRWLVSEENLLKLEKEGKIIWGKNKTRPYRKLYLDERQGNPLQDVWDDINNIQSGIENVGYPTQKPEKLLERIIKASSNEGDIVLDAFCGSGTTLAVAEKLNRKWIGIDAGKVAIHTTKKRILDLEYEHKPFAIYNSGVYEMKEVAMGGKQLKIDEKLYKQFACALFGIDTAKAKKEKGVEYDGVGRGNINSIVLSSEGYITKTILKKLAKHIGKGRVYLLFSQNQDRVFANTLEIDSVKFYLHKIPYSLVDQFVLDCERGGDISAITRNLRDIVLCKADGVDSKAIEKIGKIAQPKSKKEVEQKFSNITGFDFVDTTKFEIKTKNTIKNGQKTIKLESIKTPQGEGIDKLAMILVDANWDGKVLRPTHTFWAENYIEEDEDGNKNEIEGFVNKKCITFDNKNKPFAVLYIDDFGNEFLEEII